MRPGLTPMGDRALLVSLRSARGKTCGHSLVADHPSAFARFSGCRLSQLQLVKGDTT